MKRHPDLHIRPVTKLHKQGNPGRPKVYVSSGGLFLFLHIVDILFGRHIFTSGTYNGWVRRPCHLDWSLMSGVKRLKHIYHRYYSLFLIMLININIGVDYTE